MGHLMRFQDHKDEVTNNLTEDSNHFRVAAGSHLSAYKSNMPLTFNRHNLDQQRVRHQFNPLLYQPVRDQVCQPLMFVPNKITAYSLKMQAVMNNVKNRNNRKLLRQLVVPPIKLQNK